MSSLFDDISEEARRGPVKPSIARVRYTHDAMIDEILVNPAIHQNDLAKMFGFSATWISIVINSDAFQERLTERKAELVDPQIKATLDEKVMGAANRAMERLIERLDSPIHGSIKTQDLIGIAKLAVSPKAPAAPAIQQNLYVVSLPSPAQNSQAWLENASRSTPRGVIPMVQEVPRG
jgi:hypothetical protein